MLSYDVMTEEEANRERFKLLSDGDYPGVIKKAVSKISSNGNSMLELDVNVYDSEGRSYYIKDYLVLSRGMMWKFIHACLTTGLNKEYESKQLKDEMFNDKNVVVRIRTQEGGLIPDNKLNGKPQGSKYPDRNVIHDYIASKLNVEKKGEAPEFSDDIPF